jgi:hypothetical protein
MSSRKYFVCLEPGSAPCSKGDDEHDNIEGGTGEEAAADGRLPLARLAFGLETTGKQF